ncbi:MAG: segregation/condensation protein A [Planctomycetota bacterium]
MTAPHEYKVSLDHFAGPMDLLLYLIRKEEVEIYEIPIGNILDQYLAYLELLQEVSLDDAGDFAVMASTLMVIKSKMLLPVEEVDLAEELDPRYELVQQLLEYKKIKERSKSLENRAHIQIKRLGRPTSARPEGEIEEDRTLDELQVWDLFRYFQKVMSETLMDARKDRVITGRQVPVRSYAAKLEKRVRQAPIFLSELVGDAKDKSELIGYFLAILLLLKTQVVSAVQSGQYGDIRITPRELSDEARAQELELADDFRD